MGWRIELSEEAKTFMANLDHSTADRLWKFMRRIESLPHPQQVGNALSGPLGDFWRYRSGDYRLICRIKDDHLLVAVVKIGHRSKVYKKR